MQERKLCRDSILQNGNNIISYTSISFIICFMIYNFTDLCAIAEEAGFSKCGKLELSSLVFMPEVRDMCRADLCHSYGKNWCCPPACGTIEEAAARAKNYSFGILVQTIGETEDDFDYEGMQAAADKHDKHFACMLKMLRELGYEVWALGAGACKLCTVCTYPDAPCRFPNEAYFSMEASGLWVSKICELSSLPYYYGKNTITYTGCFLLK